MGLNGLVGRANRPERDIDFDMGIYDIYSFRTQRDMAVDMPYMDGGREWSEVAARAFLVVLVVR